MLTNLPFLFVSTLYIYNALSNRKKSRSSAIYPFDVDEGYPTWDDWIEFGDLNDVSIYLPIVMESEDDIIEFKNKSKTFFAIYDSNYPTVIIECWDENDVVNTMKFLSNKKYNKMAFTIKSGGHGFGGYNKIYGAAMITVSELKEIEIINRDDGIVSVEPGVTNIELVHHMIDNNIMDMIFPTGECPTVAFGGLVTGGGISAWSRNIGLAVDTVIGARLVMYDGQIIDTYYDNSHNKYDDLLWAVKGSGGQNFGIITKYYLQSVPHINKKNRYARHSTIQYQINANKENIYNFFNGISSLFEDKQLESVSFQSENADYIGQIVNLYAFESGLKKCDKDNTKLVDKIIKIMNGFMNQKPHTFTTIFDEYYIVQNNIFDDFPATNTDFIGMNQVRFITSWQKDGNINKIAAVIANGWGDLIQTFNVNQFSPIRFGYIMEQLQGKVIENDPNFKKTSFQNRDAIATFHVRFRWDYPEQNGNGIKYIKIVDENLLSQISNVNYMGYITNLSGNANLDQYYPNKKIFQKQRKIKSKYDPKNRFKFEMSIPPL